MVNFNSDSNFLHNKIIYRKDYKEPDYLVKYIFLYFNILSWEKMEVTSYIFLYPNSLTDYKNLILNGESLKSLYFKLNGVDLVENKDYSLSENSLTINKESILNLSNHSFLDIIKNNLLPTFSFVKEKDFIKDVAKHNLFLLETKVEINPQDNTHLLGIYRSQNYLCSQCEAEGFRRITWYIDRPDNMAIWNVAIEADKNQFPILLSNGNKLIEKALENNRHLAIFNDPFNKPSYLFALVAGDFDILHSTYTTLMSNRKIDLFIYTNKGEIGKAHYAMQCLKKAMEWDESFYGLEYDLNIFSIVAIKDFNFGAMENKSLNLFNEMYVLADSNITTDNEFIKIEAIIAHEYFHNYTGNKVTCGDWFQLTLKEGLTVFREQKFSEMMNIDSCIRINSIELLKNKQFPEDSSPLAHPIRPESYIEIDNFYTKTVYEKGAEVVGMIQTLIGEDNFKKGLKHYLTTYDGKAATCEDFLQSMETVSNISLKQFKKWYSTKGTPLVNVVSSYNDKDQTFTIKLTQNSTTDPLVIPLKIALINKNTGEQFNLNPKNNLNITVGKNDTQGVIVLNKNKDEFTFTNIDSLPLLSINRDFSAPVVINQTLTNQELSDLILFDDNGVSKYTSSKSYLINIVLDIINLLKKEGKTPTNLVTVLAINDILSFIKRNKISLQKYDFLPFKLLIDKLKNNLEDSNNIFLMSYIFSLPSFEDIAKNFPHNIPLFFIGNGLNILKVILAQVLEADLLLIYNKLNLIPDSFCKENYSRRALKNTFLNILLSLEKEEYFSLAKDHYLSSHNMTNKIAILDGLKNYLHIPLRNELFKEFINSYNKEALVVNKYLALEAQTVNSTTIDKVKELLSNKEIFSFNNPNNVWYLLGSFAFSNPLIFHSCSGEGYELISDMVNLLDKINPSVAANLATAFNQIHKYDTVNQKLIMLYFNKCLGNKKLSKGTYEVLIKILRSYNES